MVFAVLEIPKTSNTVRGISMNIYAFQSPSGFYVYAYIREDGTPYYIGKGSGRRAVQKHTIQIPKDLHRIVICEQNLSEIGALALERRLISWYGRLDLGTGCLRNLTFGGEHMDCSSPVTRKRMSDAQKGKPKSESHRANIGAARRGKSSSIKGSHQSDAHRANISSALSGKPKVKTVCRLVDRKELNQSNFIKWLNFHYPESKELLQLI